MVTTWDMCNANGVGTLGSHVAILTTKAYDGASVVRLPWGFEPVAAIASTVTYTKGVATSVGTASVTVSKAENGYSINVADVESGAVTVIIFGAPNATF